MTNRLFGILIVLFHCAHYLLAQQVADTTYKPKIVTPEYPIGTGPIVWIDEGHFNFHTMDGMYQTFADLLIRDGYQVNPYKGEFNKSALSKGSILVISNALNEFNVKRWYVPTLSAFTNEEILVVHDWVIQGGSLFLIADHMPMGGASAALAQAFGFTFTDGFARDKTQRLDRFQRTNKSLAENSITNGRNTQEYIEAVISFTGQAFNIPDDAEPLLILGENFINYLPDTAWVFNSKTKSHSVNGWSQGAYLPYGKGRVVMFGEAAMFSAQIAGPQKTKMGMNHHEANQNYQLLLNIIHWLDRVYD